MTDFLQAGWSPFLIALGVLALGVLIWRGRKGHLGAARVAAHAGGALLTGLGALLLVGASVTAFNLISARASYPAPGKIVRVGQDRLHVFCQGPTSAPTVLLIPGGYAQGLQMYAYQEALKDRWRACTVDRAGLGWSSVGHGTPTVDVVLNQLHVALAAAGEKPASAVLGHSFGGLYSVNYASAWPDEVKAVVLLDPTEPAHTLIPWGKGRGLGGVFADTLPIVGTMFGLAYIPGLNPLLGPGGETTRLATGRYFKPVVAWELRPSSILAAPAAMGSVSKDGLSIVRTPGALPGQAIFLMTQTPHPNEPLPPFVKGPRQAANFRRLMAIADNEYASMSPRLTRAYAPVGAGHEFPFTRADITVPRVRAFLEKEVPPAGAAK